MRAGDVWRGASGALRGHGRRTLLSLLGVSVGVAAVLLLTALGEGARRYVAAQFEFLGANVIGIVPGRVETTGAIPGVGGGARDLTLGDARALARLPRVLRVAPISMGTDSVARGERSRRVIVLGGTPELESVRNLRLGSGRFLSDTPWDRGSSEAVLGARVVRELFPGQNPLGETVRVAGWRLRVVGVLASQGVHLGVDMDEVVVVPVATALRMFDRSSLFRIALQVRAAADLEAAQRQARELLAERHREEDFTILTEDAVLGSLGSIIGALTMALVGIGAVSLAVAGIGIMNVMLVSVAERRAEIGLLKAIGASPRQILGLFVAEAVLLSSAGGLLGLCVGVAAARALRLAFPEFPATPPAWAVVAALLVSALVGGLFGAWPARRAMALDPVAALSGR